MDSKKEIIDFLKIQVQLEKKFYDSIVNIISDKMQDSYENNVLLVMEEYTKRIIDSNKKILKDITIEEVFNVESYQLFELYLNNIKKKITKEMISNIIERIGKIKYEFIFESFDSVLFGFVTENNFDDLLPEDGIEYGELE